MTSPQFDSGSFRDREGRVFYHQGQIFRALSSNAHDAWRELSKRDFFHQLIVDGRLVGTQESGWKVEQLAELTPELPTSPWVAALEHERIPFISYPYEWTFGMLRDAALLQLELLGLALADDMTLKDATPYNVQWRGCEPVFIDISSFESWKAGDPWVGYLQFCQLFLYPLLLTAYRDLPFHPWLRGSIDGIAPEDCDRILGWHQRLKPGVLTHVYLQARWREKARQSPKTNPEKADQRQDEPMQADTNATDSVRKDLRQAGFSKEMIQNNLRGLEKLVSGLKWKATISEWSAYASDNSYDAENRQAKERFIAQAAGRKHWPLVWDLGANTGHFSRLIASHADLVVAFDSDHLSVERLYNSLKAEGPKNILPLVNNLADASPALGWRHRERLALDERPLPELILCLALVHHLVISANLPLPDVIDWLFSLTPYLVIEFITKEDPMVKRLLRNKDDHYQDYSREVFEACLSRHGKIHERSVLPSSTRILYFAERYERSAL